MASDAPTAPVTVTGAPIKADYDLVLAHEHVLIDLSWSVSEGEQDGLVLDDPALAMAELAPLRDIRALVVDVTPDSMGRDPRTVAEISRATGVDIVLGGGPCILPTEDPSPRPPEEWERTILAGLDRRDARQAVIGEIGTSDPIRDAERSSLIGAIRAHRRRGVPLHVYLDPFGRRGGEVLSLVEEHGGDPSRTVLCHLDGAIPRGLSYHRELLERGCLIGFDVWGHEGGDSPRRWPTDAQRVEATVELVELGYAHRLVLSQDVCTKAQLKRFGGEGYDHVWRNIRPALSYAGLAPEVVHALVAGNALRLLHGPGVGPSGGRCGIART